MRLDGTLRTTWVSWNSYWKRMEENHSKKQYLLSQELRLFSKIDASDQVQKFLNYCVSQKTGQAIIKDMGWISIG